MSRRAKITLFLLALFALYLIYQFGGYLVAYTDDAYVDADWVEIAAQVSGPVAQVHVRDTQTVAKGDKLVTIEQQPYQLALAEKEALHQEALTELDRLQAAVTVAQAELASAKAAVTSAQAELALARVTQQRIAILARRQDASQQDLDEKNAAVSQAQAQVAESQAAVKEGSARLKEAQVQVTVQEAAVAKAQADVQLAQYYLDRTVLTAPADGYVTNLRLYAGDYANEGDPVLGLVETGTFRIMANYREDLLRHIRPGMTVWVLMDAHPWTPVRGTVDGLYRGVARHEGEGRLLPYVAPTTNWIRLQRRFPVRITFDDLPAGLETFMGADARTLIVYPW